MRVARPNLRHVVQELLNYKRATPSQCQCEEDSGSIWEIESTCSVSRRCPALTFGKPGKDDVDCTEGTPEVERFTALCTE